MKIGIVGLPNVGKSTLFNALTRSSVPASNFPFTTIDPHVGVVPVPDERLDRLAELVKPEKVIPATVSFVDIAGLISGASQGEGLGNQFLGHIREVDAVVMVVRAFHAGDVHHVEGSLDPARDIATIQTELALADLAIAERRAAELEKKAKADPQLRPEYELVSKLAELLGDGQPARSLPVPEDLKGTVKSLGLLTAKPIIYVANVDEEPDPALLAPIEAAATADGARLIRISAAVEAELNDLSPEEKTEYLQSLGQDRSGLDSLIREAYRLLGLQTFLTAGPQEVRAWKVEQGATAPQAAGVIHTDFEKHFIRAEIISYDDYIAAGSEAAARSAGKLRVEGRDYLMKDGDVVHFRTSA